MSTNVSSGAMFLAAALVLGLAIPSPSVAQGVDLAAGGYKVKGRVKGADGKGIAGVSMNFNRVSGTGGTPGAVATNKKGKWQQTGFAAGSVYRITPEKTGYTFDPISRQVSKAGTANFQGVDASAITWVKIPAGRFPMGCTPGDSTCSGNETPRHFVNVKAFQMAQTETTNAQYLACVRAGNCRNVTSEGGDGYPVVGVKWQDAVNFCQWAGGRLPTEAEYEYAIRGGHEDWRYPWGNSISNDNANYMGLGGRDQWFTSSAPVRSFDANPYGLYDIAGNVWEWVQDNWHETYQGAPTSGSAWTTGGTSAWRVIRGGSWKDTIFYLRVSARYWIHYESSSNDGGHRCVR